MLWLLCVLLSSEAVLVRARSFTLADGVLLALRAVKLSLEKSLLDQPTGDLLKLTFGYMYVLDEFIEVHKFIRSKVGYLQSSTYGDGRHVTVCRYLFSFFIFLRGVTVMLQACRSKYLSFLHD